LAPRVFAGLAPAFGGLFDGVADKGFFFFHGHLLVAFFAIFVFFFLADLPLFRRLLYALGFFFLAQGWAPLEFCFGFFFCSAPWCSPSSPRFDYGP